MPDAIEQLRQTNNHWPEPDRTLEEARDVPIPTFNWDAMPRSWRDFIKGSIDDTGAPPDYLAGNLLGTASGLIGNTRRVSPWLSWTETSHLWVASVGNPSAAKTPSLLPFK